MITRRRAAITVLILGNILLLGIILYASVHYFNLYRIQEEREENISAIQAPPPVEIDADFSKQTGTASPLLYGGVHHPPLAQKDAWERLYKVGVTFMRTDFNMELSLPDKITLADYQENTDDVSNPDNWNQEYIEEKIATYKLAREKGMKTLGIVSYLPKWLSYSRTSYGVPIDWEVYADIVKKHYKLYRPYLDYVEVWNEPNLPAFLQTTGSGINAQSAYVQMFTVAAQAIKEVDKEAGDGKFVQIGGPSSYIPTDTVPLEALLKDEEAKPLLDFISYHNYEHSKEPSDKPYRDMMKKYGVETLPLFITEWNVTPEMKEPHPVILTELGIPYTARKFISYMNMNIAAANYHSLKEIKTNSPRGDEGYLAFYKWEDNIAKMVPAAKTWQMFSRTMGLGVGLAKLFPTTNRQDEGLYSIAIRNKYEQQGIIVVNNSKEQQFVQINLKNINKNNPWKRVYVYEASEKNDAINPLAENIVNLNDSGISRKIYLSPYSITSVLVTNDVNFVEKMKYRFYSL